ncbi:MAG: ABC transporter substrate-binding protein [Actinomycetota bacterium]|nr:ABC transporter substrate-binding protein [Actinomycetota bacterium]
MTGTTTRTVPRRWWRWTGAVTALAALGMTASGCTGQAAEPTGSGVDAALHARLPHDVRDAGILTVATDGSYPPASFFGADGRTVVGFEPDLAEALGALLGVRVRFVVTDFTDTLDDVQAGRTDVVISAMTDTAERERQADFVNYFSAGTAILVQRGNPHGIAGLGDLCGRVVAVERGTVQVGLLQRSQRRCSDRPIQVRTHPTNDDALVELRTGRADAVLNDYPPAVWLTAQPSTRAHYQLASDTQYEPGLYGIAVAKDRTRLRRALTAALRRLVSSGEYVRILREWDVADGAVREVTVNLG